MCCCSHALDDPHPHRDPEPPGPHPDAAERPRHEFLAMGGYGVFIWPAYGVSALGILWRDRVDAGRLARGQGETGRPGKDLARSAPTDEPLDLSRYRPRASRCWPSSCSRACWAPAPSDISICLDRQARAAPSICRAWMPRAPASSRADLASGHVTVVNLFASWCVPCRTGKRAASWRCQDAGHHALWRGL